MTISQIEINIHNLIDDLKKETFIYDLLLSYGLAKSSITRLKKGSLNLSKMEGKIIWKKKLFFKEELTADLHLTITEMEEASNHNERFIITTDYKTLLAIDTKTNDRLDIALIELPKHYDFFLPWAGMEKANHQDENPADVKAAEKMAKLFDEIRKDNPDNSPEFVHSLNVFLSRLLFCFFAEDTQIFEEGQFTNSIDSHTQEDGKDLDEYLYKLFSVLNTSEKARPISLPKYLNDFPFVNGGLFRDKFNSPKFTRSSRKAILASGDQNWSAINPDIFGSMFQAVVSDDQRGSLGQHYTSVPNIMKVIKPLFLDEFNNEFENNKKSPKKLIDLLNRLGKIKIFDPACGSGNFLIISYKELRRLEIKIIQQLLSLQEAVSSFNPKAEQLSIVPKTQLSLAYTFQIDLFSRIQLTQFYGIELDDFAHEIAKLALWLAEHQMNVEFRNILGKGNATLPLKEAGNIICANACRIDWGNVCPKEENDEIYILGNPPYLGAKRQNKEQKNDLKNVFYEIDGYKNLDYISNWFFKGSDFIKNSNSKLAFVSTNSITQGDQVALLWPHIFNKNTKINFAHTTFKWANSAKGKAGVSCVIIGLSNFKETPNYIYSENHKIKCNFISPYLTANSDVIVYKRNISLSDIPEMCYGNMPLEGGHLKLSKIERDELQKNYSDAEKFIRPIIGGHEFLNGYQRYVLWIYDDYLSLAQKNNFIKERIEKVREFRIDGGDVARTLVHKAHQFRYIKEAKNNFILIPCTSSERREYLQCGFFDKTYITLNSAQILYDAPIYVFGMLSSRIHMLWSKATAGTLESRLRYSTLLCYNTFPFPNISEIHKKEIEQCVFRIIEERERYPEYTVAELYDPDKMPDGLREAHHLNDLAIERCYRSKPFESDEERLEYLFKLYEQMIAEEKERDTLFATEKKFKKRKK